MADLPKLDVVIANNFGHLPMFIGAEKGFFKPSTASTPASGWWIPAPTWSTRCTTAAPRSAT